MKIRFPTVRGPFALLLLFSLGIGSARAEDRDGWLLTVSKKTLAREERSGLVDDYEAVDRDLVLKIILKNVSIKDREAGTVDYAILVRRWGGEIGAVQRYSGKLDLKPAKRGEEVELNTEKYHIGGHLHGTSRMHVDEMEAWKLTVRVGDRTTEFRSSSRFEQLDKKAVAAR